MSTWSKFRTGDAVLIRAKVVRPDKTVLGVEAERSGVMNVHEKDLIFSSRCEFLLGDEVRVVDRLYGGPCTVRYIQGSSVVVENVDGELEVWPADELTPAEFSEEEE